MEFTDFLDGIAHLKLAPHGRTGLKYPYKLLLLASVVDLIGEGELPTPEVVRAMTGEPVRGAVVVQDVTPRLRLAARASGVSLWRIDPTHEHLVLRDVVTEKAA